MGQKLKKVLSNYSNIDVNVDKGDCLEIDSPLFCSSPSIGVI